MANNNAKRKIGTGILAAGVAAAGAVSHAATKKLVNVAIDRDFPNQHLVNKAGSYPHTQKILSKAVSKFKGSDAQPEFTQAAQQAANRLSHKGHILVEIKGVDSIRLVGHWFPCDKPQRTVIAMHGWRSSWMNDFGMISDFLFENHCNVLFAEQRAQGNSGGEHMGLGILERYDCKRWIEWVNDNIEDTLPIYLTGVSMGATTVLMASGLELPGNVCGIVADCGFTSPHAISKHVVEKNLHMSYGLRGEVANSICVKKNRVGTKDYSTIEALRGNKIPVLFIHGAEDRFVPVTMTYENYQACTGEKELLIIPGADHAMSYYTDTQRYENTVKNFWNVNDCRYCDPLHTVSREEDIE